MCQRWQDRLVVAALGTSALCLMLAAGPVRAEGKKKPAEALPADLARVPQNALMLLSVNVAELREHPAAKEMRKRISREIAELTGSAEKALEISLRDIERLNWVALVGERRRPFLFFVRTTRPYEPGKLRATLGKAREVKVGKETYLVGEGNRALLILDGRTLVVGQETEIRWLLENPQARKPGPLARAMRQVGKHAAVVVMNPGAFPPEVKARAPAELIPFLPLFDAGAGVVMVDVGERVSASLRVSFDTRKKADEAVKPLQTLVGLMRTGLDGAIKQLDKGPGDTKSLVTLLEETRGAIEKVKVRREGNNLLASTSVKVDFAGLAPALTTLIQRFRTAAARAQSSNNLKQLGLAMHNYNDHHGRLPPQAVFDKAGKPILSWRVLLLPYLEQDDLYKQFHLNEPWDSPHNKKLLARMPRVFAAPNGKGVKEHRTFYQALVGKGSIWDSKRGLSLRRNVPDGLSNTIMIVEGGKPVPWTKPEDIPFDPKKKPPRPTGLYPGGFFATLCDGSVHFIRLTVSDTTLRRAILRNDGLILGADF